MFAPHPDCFFSVVPSPARHCHAQTGVLASRLSRTSDDRNRYLRSFPRNSVPGRRLRCLRHPRTRKPCDRYKRFQVPRVPSLRLSRRADFTEAGGKALLSSTPPSLPISPDLFRRTSSHHRHPRRLHGCRSGLVRKQARHGALAPPEVAKNTTAAVSSPTAWQRGAFTVEAVPMHNMDARPRSPGKFFL